MCGLWSKSKLKMTMKIRAEANASRKFRIKGRVALRTSSRRSFSESKSPMEQA